MTTPSELANKIVEAIVRDISDRKGIGDELDGIDEDIRAEMLDEWRKIVAATLLDVRDYGWIPIYREYGARKTIIVPLTISESEADVIGCPVKMYERIVRVAGSFGMPLAAAKGEGMDKGDFCCQCGMEVGNGEYHPYAACLMFKACRDGDAVRANLHGVWQAALTRAAEVCREQGKSLMAQLPDSIDFQRARDGCDMCAQAIERLGDK